MLQKPKGTKDILPQDSYLWQCLEEKVKEILRIYGYEEIRVPVFETTELFERGVGDTTDVVQKEMYTFEDKGGRSITLRPEGTAGVVRAYIENGMASLPSPVKMWYAMPMYRYENVQKGRLREFRQIGAELIGSSSYLADIEMIMLAKQIIESLAIGEITLTINSIGCPTCRVEYQKALKEFIKEKIENYCDTCKTRFEKNPMRILDCKEEKCKELTQGAPIILDYLCEECKEHFTKVKQGLDVLEIPYVVMPGIVRGLDYYTKTVFEFISLEENYTVLAGGRYDGLIKELGGNPNPAIGFAMGEDRILEVISKKNLGENCKKRMQLFIATIGEEAEKEAIKIVSKLREKGIFVEKDVCGRSLKAQLKYADKKHSKYAIILGEEEVNKKIVKIKEMETGREEEILFATEEILKYLS